MAVYQEEIGIKTAGEGDIVDITGLVEAVVRRSGISDGVAHVFAIGSTAAISTMEYEPGLKRDLPEILERIAPKDLEYRHHLRWGDYNGHSHVRATILGPSLSVPVRGGRLVLGTWQQIIFIELDVRPRSRRIMVTVMGE
ncbi:MAG TPA: YjbQ family protein [Nitrososphaeria archaeon]|nr:YjbQ family protein [Nitrososphaeria archaeon]